MDNYLVGLGASISVVGVTGGVWYLMLMLFGVDVIVGKIVDIYCVKISVSIFLI